MISARFALVAFAALLFSVPVVAQDGAPAPAADSGPLKEAAPGGDETVTTTDGSRYTGSIQGVKNGKVAFKDATAGDIEIPTGKILDARVPSGSAVFFQRNKRDGIHRGTLSSQGGKLWLTGDDKGAVEELDPSAFFRMQRDAFSLWNFSGNFNSSLMWSDGNTEQLIYGAGLGLDLTHPEHRFQLLGDGQYGENFGILSSQRVRGQFEYNFMFLEYIGAMFRQVAEHDLFRDLRFGTITTLGATAPFINEDRYTFGASGGVTYTTQDHKLSEDNDFAGGEAAIRGTFNLTSAFKLEATSRYNVSFEETQDYTIRSRLAAHMALIAGFVTSIVFEHDYDNRPPAGLERSDTRIIFMIGWSF